MTEKITLLAEHLFLIRSTRTMLLGSIHVRYYESPSVWNLSPMRATLFQDFEAGERHLAMYRAPGGAPLGWADGSTEVLDVVPLHGEILNSPNGVMLHVRKDPS